MKKLSRRILTILLIILGFCLLAEVGMRMVLEAPLKTGFYSSIPRSLVSERQKKYGVQVASGIGWAHLGWIADPDFESYRLLKVVDGLPEEVAKTRYGSFLLRGESGIFQVWVVPADIDPPWLLGKVSLQPNGGSSHVYIPSLNGHWQTLFKPQVHGDYINDHTIYQDAKGDWRLVGITSKSDGDFDVERYFAVGVSAEFPPQEGMDEAEPVADFSELAWAPHVITQDGTYNMFWSPHNLHQMSSPDGINWGNHQVSTPAPLHKFFRDPMLVQVAPGQWLLYTNARGAYCSQIDIYQSFDLQEWQYIRTALSSAWGSEHNSPSLLTQLETHAPEIVYHTGTEDWYITATGWPWGSNSDLGLGCGSAPGI